MSRRKYTILVVIPLACLVLIGVALKCRNAYRNLIDEIQVLRAENNEVLNQVYSVESETSKAMEYIKKYMSYYKFDYSWADNNLLIAHALGAIDGKAYTNSREAFLQNYEKGFRIFEVDFTFLDDGSLVALHDKDSWYSMTGTDISNQPTLDATLFQETLLYQKYHTMNYQQVIDLMEEYPDIYIITDTKYLDSVNVSFQFSQIISYAESIDPTIAERIIPQIYYEDMLSTVMNVYPFSSVIYTLYRIEWDPAEALEFCRMSGVGYITCGIERALAYADDVAAWRTEGIKVGVHTVNEEETVEKILGKIDGVYTDSLTPSMFNQEN